jgi:hypothetical protein
MVQSFDRGHANEVLSLLAGSMQPSIPVRAFDVNSAAFVLLVRRLIRFWPVHEPQHGVAVAVLRECRVVGHHLAGFWVGPLTPQPGQRPGLTVRATEVPGDAFGCWGHEVRVADAPVRSLGTTRPGSAARAPRDIGRSNRWPPSRDARCSCSAGGPWSCCAARGLWPRAGSFPTDRPMPPRAGARTPSFERSDRQIPAGGGQRLREQEGSQVLRVGGAVEVARADPSWHIL